MSFKYIFEITELSNRSRTSYSFTDRSLDNKELLAKLIDMFEDCKKALKDPSKVQALSTPPHPTSKALPPAPVKMQKLNKVCNKGEQPFEQEFMDDDVSVSTYEDPNDSDYVDENESDCDDEVAFIPSQVESAKKSDNNMVSKHYADFQREQLFQLKNNPHFNDFTDDELYTIVARHWDELPADPSDYRRKVVENQVEGSKQLLSKTYKEFQQEKYNELIKKENFRNLPRAEQWKTISRIWRDLPIDPVNAARRLC